jgi:hypothetical protein
MGNKSTPGSSCLALLGQLKGVTYEEVGTGCCPLDKTKSVPKAKIPFGQLMLVPFLFSLAVL